LVSKRGAAWNSLFVLQALVPLFLLGSVYSARAQNSTERIQQDPRQTYFVLKASMRDRVRATHREKGAEELQLRDCVVGSTLFVVRGPLRTALVDFAYAVLAARATLLDWRVPSELWQEALTKAEEVGLAAIARGDIAESKRTGVMDAFARDLNRSIRAKKLKLPPVNANPECGGPPSEYKVTTIPSHGQVQVIPKLFYIVCQKQNIDPDDTAKCDNWFPPIRHGERVYLGGVYKYRIRWEARATPVKEFDADRYNETIALE